MKITFKICVISETWFHHLYWWIEPLITMYVIKCTCNALFILQCDNRVTMAWWSIYCRGW